MRRGMLYTYNSYWYHVVYICCPWNRLYELQPSTELTGGVWYSDLEFDHEFISELRGFLLQCLRRLHNGRGCTTTEILRTMEQANVSKGMYGKCISSRRTFYGLYAKYSSNLPPLKSSWTKKMYNSSCGRYYLITW